MDFIANYVLKICHIQFKNFPDMLINAYCQLGLLSSRRQWVVFHWYSQRGLTECGSCHDVRSPGLNGKGSGESWLGQPFLHSLPHLPSHKLLTP